MAQKITPFLWFVDNCEEAIDFYTSVFRDAKKGEIQRTPDGKAFTGSFWLFGQEFMALNGGPVEGIKFTEAISFFVRCADQAEVDYYWEALTAEGGEESQCGWLKDKFGVSWQIIPDALMQYLSDPDRERSGRAMQAMLKMKKIVVADLDKAANPS